MLAAWAVRNERGLSAIRAGRGVLYAMLASLTASALLLVLVGPYGKGATSDLALFPPTYGFALLGLLFTCALLIDVTERRGLVSFVTRNRLLGKLGVIGYGTYLFQLPVQGLVTWLILGAPFEDLEGGADLAINLVSLTLTLTLAALSWRFFEKRIVNWGRSFLYEGARSPSTA